MAVDTRSHTVTPARRRFTIDEYYRLGEAGILGPDERVELIDGEVVCMNPVGPGHAGSVERLADLLRGLLGSRAQVRLQNPIRLPSRSEPEPDLAVVQRRTDYYRAAHPTPADVLLVVEVSDTTLAYDRDVKGPLYARAGIAEYWIVDLGGARVLVHREPSPDGYRSVGALGREGTLAPLAFPDLALAVADVLG